MKDILLDGQLKQSEVLTAAGRICLSLGINHRSRWESKDQGESFQFYAQNHGTAIDAKGFDWAVRINTMNASLTVEGSSFTSRMTGPKWEVSEGKERAIQFDMAALPDRPETRQMSGMNQPLIVEGEGAHWVGRFYVENLIGRRKEGRWEFQHANGLLFLKRKI
jgi:hypothetical protein